MGSQSLAPTWQGSPPSAECLVPVLSRPCPFVLPVPGMQLAGAWPLLTPVPRPAALSGGPRGVHFEIKGFFC